MSLQTRLTALTTAIGADIKSLKSRVLALETPETWRSIAASGQPAFGTGWSNFGSGQPDAAFRKNVGNMIQLRGMIKRTASSQLVMFVLPVGYRPSITTRIMVMSFDGTTETPVRVTISTDGSVQLAGAVSANTGTNWVFVDGVTFATD